MYKEFSKSYQYVDDNEFHDGTLLRLQEYSAVFRPYMELVAVVVVQLHRPEKRMLHDLLKNKNIIRKKSGKGIEMFLLNGNFFHLAMDNDVVV